VEYVYYAEVERRLKQLESLAAVRLGQRLQLLKTDLTTLILVSHHVKLTL